MANLFKVSLARTWALLGLALLSITAVAVPVQPANADSISQTKALLASLSATLAKQDALSESLAERYNAARSTIATLDASLASLNAQIAVKRSQITTTSHSLVNAAVRAYVLGAADSQYLVIFRQDLSHADARVRYEDLVLGNLHAVANQLQAQQHALAVAQNQAANQRAQKAREAANVQSLLAQNARNEAATRTTLAKVTRRLARQIIDYEIVVAIAASKRHDTQAVAAAIAAAAAVGGQAAANEVTAALTPSHGVGGTPAGSREGLAALAAAKSVIGLPYVWGGESPRYGFDCSGLTQWAWRQAGYSIPRTAAMQWYGMRHVSLSALQPGDLLFYYNLDNDHQVDHVVMYAGSGPWGTNTIIAAAHRGTNISLAPIFTYGLIGAGRP